MSVIPPGLHTDITWGMNSTPIGGRISETVSPHRQNTIVMCHNFSPVNN
jgi:hypothetical protein